MKICPSCNQQYPDTSRFCRGCGAALVSSAAGSPEMRAKHRVYEMRIAEEPRNTSLLAEYGVFLAGIGLFDEALVQLHTASELDPGDQTIRRQIVDAYRAARRWPEAVNHLRQLVEARPEDSALRYEYVATLDSAGRLGEAADALAQMRARSPSDLEILRKLRDVLRRLNRLPELVACCRQILGLDQSDAVSWKVLANGLLSLARLGEALDAFRRLLELDPDNARACLYVGIASYDAAGAAPDADISLVVDLLERALKRVSSLDQPQPIADADLDRIYFQESHRALLYLSSCRMRRGSVTPQVAQDLKVVEPSQVTDPDRPVAADCLVRLGKAFEQEQRIDDAIPCYERALAFADDKLVRSRLAVIYADRGDSYADSSKYLKALKQYRIGLGWVLDDARCATQAAQARRKLRSRVFGISLAAAVVAAVLLGGPQLPWFRSQARGAEWQLTNFPDPGTAGMVSALAVSSTGQLFAAVAVSSADSVAGLGVFRSTDQGRSWVQLTAGLATAVVTSLAIGPDGALFAGTVRSGVYRSTDGGNSWVRTSLTTNGWGLTASGSSLYALVGALCRSLFRSRDNGVSWTQLGSGLVPCVNTLVVGSSGALFAGTDTSGVYRSTDDGMTWVPINSGLTNRNVATIAVSGSGDLFVGTFAGGVYRSINNGGSWTQVNRGLPSLRIRGLGVASAGELYASFIDVAGVFRSTDSGSTWSARVPGLGRKNQISAMTFQGSRHGLVSDGRRVWYRSLSGAPLALYDTGSAAGSSAVMILDAARLAFGSQTYREMAQGRKSGQYARVLEHSTESARDVVRVVTSRIRSDWRSSDTVWMDAASLAPIRIRHLRYFGGQTEYLRLDYVGTRVRGHMRVLEPAGVREADVDTTLAGGTPDSYQLWTVVSLLPLAPAGRWILSVYSASQAVVRTVAVSVAGEEAVTVPAGSFACWRVVAESEGQAPITYFVTKSAPYVIVKSAVAGQAPVTELTRYVP